MIMETFPNSGPGALDGAAAPVKTLKPTLLGRGFDDGSEYCVYLADGCLEIEYHNPVDIVRRRVFLDEVAMVTLSRRLGWVFISTFALLCVLAGTGLLVSLIVGSLIGSIVGGVLIAVFGGICVFRLINRLDVITIFGHRKKIEIVFGIDKSKVQETFDTIVEAMRSAIAATNARVVNERQSAGTSSVEAFPDDGPFPVSMPPLHPTNVTSVPSAGRAEPEPEFLLPPLVPESLGARAAPPVAAPESPSGWPGAADVSGTQAVKHDDLGMGWHKTDEPEPPKP